MTRKKLDENEAAARVVRRATSPRDDELSPSIEAAWADWSRRIQGIDERTRTLLRAAFEVGVASANLGRIKGGRAGGAARKAKLTPRERSQIARKAAETRWRSP